MISAEKALPGFTAGPYGIILFKGSSKVYNKMGFHGNEIISKRHLATKVKD